MAYVLYIDYMAGHQPDIEYKVLYTENLLDAIKEADTLMTENSDVYLMRVMQENSRMEETRYHAENGEPRALFKAEYKAIRCKRNTSPESILYGKIGVPRGRNKIRILECFCMENSIVFKTGIIQPSGGTALN